MEHPLRPTLISEPRNAGSNRDPGARRALQPLRREGLQGRLPRPAIDISDKQFERLDKAQRRMAPHHRNDI